ncbi:MAG: type II secretion system protein, partial [Candidatus Omnitrophota bacterium]
MRKRRGFFFIELLVHLALIAVLIGIIIPYYKNMKRRIGLRICHRELSILKTALESYYESQAPKHYPPTTENLCAEYLINAKPQVVTSVLIDPFSRPRREYHYALSPNEKFYCVWTVGLNRKSQIQGIDDEGNVIKDP